MSRRSAADTDTGTAGAVFARAEFGFGSPPHPNHSRHNRRINPIAARGKTRLRVGIREGTTLVGPFGRKGFRARIKVRASPKVRGRYDGLTLILGSVIAML